MRTIIWVLAVSVGKPSEALLFLKLALESNPVKQFWLSYVDTLIRLERFDEANRVWLRGEGVSPASWMPQAVYVGGQLTIQTRSKSADAIGRKKTCGKK